MEVIEVTEKEIEIVEVVERGPQGPAGPQPNINYTVVSSSRTLEVADLIAADTSGGAFTLTLPASPSNGDAVDIFDFSDTFDTNNLTIARNGSKIESLTEDLVCNVEGAYFTMIYTGATRGWQVLPRYGTSGGGGESTLTTQGDTLYRGASSNSRLPIGTAGQFLKVNSGATAPEWATISKSTVGLANVDNTSDANKPVSTATQTALNLKADLASPALTGTPTAPTASAGTNTTQIATTAFTIANRGDRYLTTSTTSHSLTTGSKTFTVQSGLSYIATQDITIVADADPVNKHMHGVVTSYSGTTLVVDIQTVNQSGGPYTAWTINVGGLLSSEGVLYSANNLSDVANTATALTNLGGVPTSRTVSAGTGLTGGGDLTANRTLAVSYGTTSGTACQGNDGRINYINSNAIDQRVLLGGGGSSGTIVMTAVDGIAGSINTSDGGGSASGGSINTTGHISGSVGGSINTSAGVGGFGGSINTSNGGGSIDTRGTGSIQFGVSGTRTTLTGTATADRAVSLPDTDGMLIVQNSSSIVTYGGDITIGDLGGYGGISGFGRTIDFEQNAISGFNIASSGSITASGLTQATNRLLGRTTASTGAVEEVTVAGGASLSAGALTVHAQSHAITSTSDHTAGNNKVFYSNNSGQVTELALGAANTVLTSNGATSAPTFSALPSGGSKTYFRATALDNQPPSTGFATLDTRNSIAVLDFDDAATESAVFVGVMPEGASLGSGLIAYLHFMATTATSGNVRWSVSFERGNTDLDADSFDTATAATTATSSTSGIPVVSAITCTAIDSVAAGDLFRFRVQRLGADAADTMSGDAELVAVEIRSAA